MAGKQQPENLIPDCMSHEFDQPCRSGDSLTQRAISRRSLFSKATMPGAVGERILVAQAYMSGTEIAKQVRIRAEE